MVFLLLLALTLTNPELGSTFTVIMSEGPTTSPVDGPQSNPTKARSSTTTRTDPTEQEAVYDVMKATGNEWALEIEDVCRGRWHGIECMPDRDNTFHVVSLSFGSLSDDTAFPTCDSARSYISPSVTKLRRLKTLFFYRCLTNNPQPIPSFLGDLGPGLRTLVLRENGHVGPIPAELGKLTGLTALDLHRNNLKGSIPASLGGLTGLRLLDLSSNRLSGFIPNNVSFPSLRVLDFSQNRLKGSIPPPLLSGGSLLKVDLSRNRISGRIPELEGQRDLTLLDLSYNALSGPLPSSSWKELKSLQALMLNGNTMEEATVVPESMFEGLKNLMILRMSNMNMEGKIPESLGRLRSLRVLHLDGNRFNGSIPRSFADGLSGLSELRLDGNGLTGRVPFTREGMWRMGRKLRLENNLGLCYDARSGLADDLEALADAGIGRCEEQQQSTTVSVQHISDVTSTASAFSLLEMRRTSMIGILVLYLLCYCLF